MKNFLRQAAALLAGRWQMPLAVCAVLAAAAALRGLKPPPRAVNFDALLADLRALEQGGQFTAATDAAANLLEMQPPLPPAQRAQVHEALADIIYRQELARGAPNRENVKLLLKHQAEARELGRTPPVMERLQAAQAHEWLDQPKEALEAYRELVASDVAADERRRGLQALVRLLEDQTGEAARTERGRHLRALLGDEGISAGYLWWGLRRVLEDTLEQGTVAEAQALLDAYGDRLKSSDLKGYFEHLAAWIALRDGRPDEAEARIYWIEDWLENRGGLDRRLDEYGHLPALNRWLLGQAHLAEQRPQEALHAFENALALHSHGDFGAQATLGQGGALCQLERHEAARRLFEAVAQRLQPALTARRHTARLFADGLLDLFHRCDDRGDFENAVGYLDLAARLTPADEPARRLDLLEKLGQAAARAADGAADAEHGRARRREAGQAFEAAAKLARLDEPRYATLLWSAAEQYDEAGRSADARRALLQFVEGRAGDPRLPRAMLRLGQTFEADGRLEDAGEWYRRVSENFPQLEEAAQAKLLHAGGLIALGRDRYPEAERLLAGLLEDDQLAPEAPAFRDALFALCDLLYDQERYGEAIGRLEDFVALYPQDLERARGRFMLADAYRRSAYALRKQAAASADTVRETSAAEGRRRFLRAAALFDEFLREAERAGGDGETAALYERLSLLYRGDCLFELNEPEPLNEALTIYRQAAVRYENEPTALSAQVQIANIHLRLGKLTEAARALERARWLVRNIPDPAFARAGDGADRAAWDRYLTAVSASHLFRDVLSGAQ